MAEAAARRRRRGAVRLEAQLAADDPDDLAEARQVREEMDLLRPAPTSRRQPGAVTRALDEIGDELADADAKFVAETARQALARSDW